MSVLLENMDHRSPNIQYVLHQIITLDFATMTNVDHATLQAVEMFTAQIIAEINRLSLDLRFLVSVSNENSITTGMCPVPNYSTLRQYRFDEILRYKKQKH